MTFESWYKKNKKVLDKMSLIEQIKFAWQYEEYHACDAEYREVLEKKRQAHFQRWPNEPFDPYR